MKKIIFTSTFLLVAIFSQAQINILNRVKQSAKNKVNSKIDEKINNGVDKAVDGADDAATGKNKKANGGTNNQPNSPDNAIPQKGTDVSLKSYTKFDFVPGEKIVASEDFAQDAIGDFPDKWNTNGGGEIVTLNKLQGKYLMTQKEVVFYPEWIKNLPDNFTLEFDLASTEKFSFYSGYFLVGATTSNNVGKNFREFARFGNGRIANGGGFEVGFHPQNAGGQLGLTNFYSSYNQQEILKNESDQDKFTVKTKTNVHISIWRQKTRVRVYMDDKKIWDLPKALQDGMQLNNIYFRNNAAANDDDNFYMTNLRVAVGAPDTRNKLITEGKFVTHGILFDVNSDKIKAQSFGALKDIAAVLTENADVKVKIVGHTDSDGDDGSNLALSKKRADAVKASLVKDFGIDASRLETDGKGESQPMDKNTSAEGKANNRRVEFIKL